MKRFVEAVKNMFRIEDLRNRVLFTLALLAVYRIGAYIPIPGINSGVLDQLFNQAAGSVLGIFNLFSGGNYSTGFDPAGRSDDRGGRFHRIRGRRTAPDSCAVCQTR